MGNIIVKLQLKGPLKKYGPDSKVFEYKIAAESCNARVLLQNIGIPASSVSFIQIDGKKSNPDAILKGGELIIINPRVAGG